MVIKLLGKSIGYLALKDMLKCLRKTTADFDVMSTGNGYFMVKFDNSEDREKVIGGRPWLVQDHYLAVKEWSPEFNPSDNYFGRTMVWVRLSRLNML